MDPEPHEAERVEVKTSAYLVITPGHNWQGAVESIDVDRITKGPPKLRSNEIAIKLVIDIEKNVFEQFLPEVTIKLDDPRQFTVPQVDIETPTQPAPGDESDGDTEGAGE